MVSIDEVEEPTETPPSQERRMDADDLERILPQLKRPTAKMQLESLVKKMRKEAAALQAMEESNGKASVAAASVKDSSAPGPAPDAPIPAPAPAAKGVAAAVPPVTSPSVMYTNVDRFSFDAGSYNEKFVTLYLPLPGVGDLPKDQIKVAFGADEFDVTVLKLGGKNYRLKKNNLEHPIVPEKSKFVVKADKIIVKLHKVKGEYGSYDFWSKLSDPKQKDKKNKDPAASITDMMKEMYENGDDKMKKMIGETMLKQRNGELNNGPGMGMGGLDGGYDD